MAMEIQETRYVRSRDCVERIAQEQTLLVHARSGRCFVPDAAGLFLWEALREPVSFAKLEAICLKRFSGDARQMSSELRSLLNTMLQQGLVCEALPGEAVKSRPVPRRVQSPLSDRSASHGTFVRRVRTAARMSEAFFWLATVWVVADVLHSALILRLLPPPEDPSETSPEPATEVDPRTSLIRVAVMYVSRRVPFRSVCLHRGIATDHMLRRRGLDSRIHYGVALGADGWQSHLWVSSAGRPVVGAREAEAFAEVANYRAP